VKDLSLLIPLLIVVALFALSQRARRRAAAQQAEQQSALRPGVRVMTTSGLYGTVVALADDESANLEIAPGVVVTWARAALRPADSPKRLHSEPGTAAQAVDDAAAPA
jgi:preprotein translocase subunit YajC